MRKVTASAVILTALTGCSQSSIPSTQWSFEVPSEEPLNDSLGASLVSDESSTADLSQEARSFISQTASGGRMMGPAFEQPAAEPSRGSSVSAVGSPSSKAASTLAAEAYGITSGLSTQPSTRPDPVAQVRAYLRSSGSPSALTNRTPYKSEVYLSSLPTPNQYYEPSIPAVETAFPAGISTLGLTDSLPSPLPSTEFTLESAVSPEIAPASPTAMASAPTATVSTRVSTTAIAVSDSFDDSLPQLEPELSASAAEAPTSTYEAPPSVTSESNSDAIPSIGTAILQDLRRQGAEDTVISQPADAGLPSLVGNAPTVELDQSARVEPSQSLLSEAEKTPDISSFEEPTSLDITDVTAGDYAYTPAPESQPLPTLASLTETMPVRDTSPLVDSFRSSDSLPSDSEAGTLESAPNSEFDLEASGDASIHQPSYYAPGSFFESSSSLDSPEADLSYSVEVSDDYSPLLQGLTGSADSTVESTIYVPIAGDAATPSDLLLQDAADALNELSDEVSMTDFLNELAARSIFSSVLTSGAFSGGESVVALDSLQSRSDDKVETKRSLLKAAHRSEAVALAAKRASQRRQRLTWM